MPPVLLRLLALLLLPAFAAACTRQVARPPLEVHHYSVDWETVERPPLRLDGLLVQGVVLTPAQWPLEASVRHLLEGDFVGVVEALDLRFRASRIPEGVPGRLYEAGFLAAYVRVRNPTGAPRAFFPERLGVATDGATLLAVPPEALPRYLEEVDWARVGLVALSGALLLAILLAGREGRLDAQVRVDLGRVPGHVLGEAATPRPRPPAPARGPDAEPGLLAAGTLAPGEAREGFVFFRLGDAVADWREARLTVW